MNNQDHSDLRALFAHHDVEIGALATRVGKVEQTIESGFAKVGENFSKLEGIIIRSDAKQGPGIGDVMKAVATGGAIVGMSAAAITMLVQSFISPELTNLKDTAQTLSKDHDLRIEHDAKELARLREDRKDKIETEIQTLSTTVNDLKDRIGWAPEVKRAGGRGF